MVGYRNTSTGALVSVRDDKVLGSEWERRDAAPASDERATIADVLAEVGEDPVKAQAALDVEQASDKPRSTLVAKLTDLAAAE